MQARNIFDYIKIILAIVLMIVVAIATCGFISRVLESLITGDSAWILKTGEYIIANKTIPAGDIFSWTKAGESIVQYQWLFMLLIAGIEDIIGRGSMLKLFTLVYLIAFVGIPLIHAKRNFVSLWFIIILALPLIVMLQPLFTLRPQVITCLFLVLQYILIFEVKENRLSEKKAFIALVVMYLFWGNIHTGVVLGLCLFLLQALGDLIEYKRIYKVSIPQFNQPVLFSRYLILILVCFLASLINPYGIGIYTHLWDIAQHQQVNQYILELKGNNFPILFLLLPVLLIIILRKLKYTCSGQNILILLGFFLYAICSLRGFLFLSLFYCLLMPMILNNVLSSELDNNKSKIKQFLLEFNFLNKPIVYGLILGCILCILKPVPAMAQYGSCSKYKNGIDFYKLYAKETAQDTIKLFNDDMIGSCLILLKGDSEEEKNLKVSFDTRFDFYRDYALEVTNILFSKEEDIVESFDKYCKDREINYVLLSKKSPLSRKILQDERFSFLYEDKYLVFVKREDLFNSAFQWSDLKLGE